MIRKLLKVKFLCLLLHLFLVSSSLSSLSLSLLLLLLSLLLSSSSLLLSLSSSSLLSLSSSSSSSSSLGNSKERKAYNSLKQNNNNNNNNNNDDDDDISPAWEILDPLEFIKMSTVEKRAVLRKSGVTRLPRPRDGISSLDSKLLSIMDDAVRNEVLRLSNSNSNSNSNDDDDDDDERQSTSTPRQEVLRQMGEALSKGISITISISIGCCMIDQWSSS